MSIPCRRKWMAVQSLESQSSRQKFNLANSGSGQNVIRQILSTMFATSGREAFLWETGVSIPDKVPESCQEIWTASVN